LPWFAAIFGRCIVEFLVEKGAAVNPKNKNGRTPLDVAEGEYFQATFQIHQSTVDLCANWAVRAVRARVRIS
jgi:hypothetical protein